MVVMAFNAFLTKCRGRPSRRAPPLKFGVGSLLCAALGVIALGPLFLVAVWHVGSTTLRAELPERSPLLRTLQSHKLEGREGTAATSLEAFGACACEGADTDHVILTLASPAHFFTSAHWFHIGEHYLAHHAAVAPLFWGVNGTIFIGAARLPPCH